MSESLAQEKDGFKSAVPHRAHAGKGGTSLERTRKRPLGQAQRDEGNTANKRQDTVQREIREGAAPAHQIGPEAEGRRAEPAEPAEPAELAQEAKRKHIGDTVSHYNKRGGIDTNPALLIKA